MEQLSTLIEALRKAVDLSDKRNSAISVAPIGWHIEHSLLVFNGITKSMEKSNPKDYKWTFNPNRVLVMSLLNKIPRGKAQAPEAVRPKEAFSIARIEEQLSKAEEAIAMLDTLPPYHFFEHPYFGKLKVKTAKQFLLLHTKHHLDIIHDIKNS